MKGQSRRWFVQRSLSLAGLGLLAGCGVLPPGAQPPRMPQRIGHVSAGTPAPELRTAFRDLIVPDSVLIQATNVMQ